MHLIGLKLLKEEKGMNELNVIQRDETMETTEVMEVTEAMTEDVVSLYASNEFNPMTPSHEAYSHDDDLKTSNLKWMKDIPDNTKLTELSMPGTHDTMALYGIEYAVCQKLTLEKQLESGIRALDIRCRHIEDKFAIHHGAYFQKIMFGAVLEIIANFLRSNPTEFIIMRVKQEYKPENNKKTFDEVFEGYWANPAYPFLKVNGIDPDDITIEMLRGKILVLDNFSNSITYGTRYYDFNIQDYWELATITKLYAKWEAVKEQLQITNESKKGKYINFLSGSPCGSFPYFVASGHSDPRTNAPRLLTGRTTQGWSSWKDFPRVGCLGSLCSIAYEGTNILTAQRIGASFNDFVGIVYADFPGPALIDNIIGLNDKLINSKMTGLRALLRRLVSIKPKSENKVEWKAIRDSITYYKNEPEFDQFKSVLTVLSKIKPKRANKKEWEIIRSVCDVILKSITLDNQNEQFRKLVAVLSTIEPKSDNKVEWHAIRFTCQRIY